MQILPCGVVLLVLLRLLLCIPCQVARPLALPQLWRTGDMVLFRTTCPLFRLSTVITQAEFSHIGVVLAPPHTAQPMLLESLDAHHHAMVDVWTGQHKHGPQMLPLLPRIREYVQRRGGYVVVRKLRGPCVADATPRIREFACAVPHFPTVHDLVLSVLMAILQDKYVELLPPQVVPPDTICCSAFVAQCYRLWGIMSPTVHTSFIYPSLFAEREETGEVSPLLGLQDRYCFAPSVELLLSSGERPELEQAQHERDQHNGLIGEPHVLSG